MEIKHSFNYEYLKNEMAKMEAKIVETITQMSETKDLYEIKRLKRIVDEYHKQIYDLKLLIPEERWKLPTQNHSLYKQMCDDWENILEKNSDYLAFHKKFLPLLERFQEKSDECSDKYDLFGLQNTKSDLINAGNTEMSYEDIITIVHDFYNSLNDETIKDAFNKIFANRENNLIFKGDSSYINEYVDSDHKIQTLLTITDEKKASTIIEASHEYGHAIDNWLKNPTRRSRNDLFEELLPIFFQTLMCRYMIDNNISPNYTPYYEFFWFKKMMYDAYAINIFNECKKKYFNNLGEFNDYIKDNYPSYWYEYVRSKEVSDFFKYSLPYSVVIELISMYEKDPEQTLIILKEVAIDSTQERYPLLERHNIVIGEHVEDYAKKLHINLKNIK